VKCHNKWEKLDEIKELREMNDAEPGKIFQQHELLGALSIKVLIQENVT